MKMITLFVVIILIVFLGIVIFGKQTTEAPLNLEETRANENLNE